MYSIIKQLIKLHFILQQVMKSNNLFVYIYIYMQFIYIYICNLYKYYHNSFAHRLLKGAEEIQLKKAIKIKYGGGNKEFIFDEQEFYENIEDENLFFTTQEKQSIVYEFLNQIKCNTDVEEIILNNKKVQNGRKLSNNKCYTFIYSIITNFLSTLVFIS